MEKLRSPKLHEIISRGNSLEFKKNEIVYSTAQGNRIMFIQRGFVKRYMIKNDGSIGIQTIYGPQDIFSFTTIFPSLLGQSLYDGPEAYYYKTLCTTRLYAIGLDEFKKALASLRLPYKELFAEAGQHLKYCVHNIENIGIGDTYTRVAHQLLFFVREFGREVPEGTKLETPLTHQDLADILGVTRETVTLAIMKLRDSGVIMDGRSIVVPDMSRLSAAAYG